MPGTFAARRLRAACAACIYFTIASSTSIRNWRRSQRQAGFPSSQTFAVESCPPGKNILQLGIGHANVAAELQTARLPGHGDRFCRERIDGKIRGRILGAAPSCRGPSLPTIKFSSWTWSSICTIRKASWMTCVTARPATRPEVIDHGGERRLFRHAHHARARSVQLQPKRDSRPRPSPFIHLSVRCARCSNRPGMRCWKRAVFPRLFRSLLTKIGGAGLCSP